VTFKDGSTTLGSKSLANGSAMLVTQFTTSGTHSLTAAYGGDGSNPAITSDALSQTIADRIATTTSLRSNASTIVVGQSMTLSAQVVGGLGPTGTMTFNDGAITLGTAAVHGGEADLVTSFSTAGTHTVTAIYSGDIANAGAHPLPSART
jgi:hypothetical protein